MLTSKGWTGVNATSSDPEERLVLVFAFRGAS
jgi:hypothetical protein